jgi:hypothetical protein
VSGRLSLLTRRELARVAVLEVLRAAELAAEPMPPWDRHAWRSGLLLHELARRANLSPTRARMALFGLECRGAVERMGPLGRFRLAPRRWHIYEQTAGGAPIGPSDDPPELGDPLIGVWAGQPASAALLAALDLGPGRVLWAFEVVTAPVAE